jgi:hypothetical protein
MSQITIFNETPDLVRIAIYKKPVLQPTLDTVAWQIVAPPPGGQTVVPIPEDYHAYAEYSLDPNNPNPTLPDATVYQTNFAPFNETSARFVIGSVRSQDNRASGAVVNQVFTDLVLNEVRMENNFGVGVLSHIQKAGQDIYAPQVLWPGGVRMEDIRATFYLAVVSQFVFQGSRLLDEETQMTETPILEGGTATVTGSMWRGYSISTT